MTTDLARSFADEIAGLGDFPTEGTLEPGRMAWLHGVKQAKTPGVFYVKDTELTEQPSAPWAVDERFDDELGYSTSLLKLAIIGWRSQWFIPGREEGERMQWLDGYVEGVGAKKQTEYLCMVEGVDDPLVLSVSGKYKAAPLFDIATTYERGLLKQASRLAKRLLPRWAFWLPIQNQMKDGKINYIAAADGNGKEFGSVVTPPALCLPPNPINELYVGNDMVRRGAEIRDMYGDWFKVKRGNHVEGEFTVTETPARLALPAPSKNQPQPLTDEEMDAIDAMPF